MLRCSVNLDVRPFACDAAATEAAGARLASSLRRRMIVTLSGELGAGKTTLVARLPARARLAGRGEEPDLHAG